MNGDALFIGLNLCFQRFDPFESEAREYESLQELGTVEELMQRESTSKSESYKAPTPVFSNFLQERFGKNLPEFMEMYSTEHFKALGFGSDAGFALPVGPTTIGYFGETSNPAKLANYLSDYQASVTKNPFGGTRLNLHNDMVYKFTLIRAKFSLKDEKNRFFFGYHFTTDKFRFFIKSSVQFDLTVVYEEL